VNRHIALRTGRPGAGPVVCWLSRDQRAADNPALYHAREEARWRERSLVTVFCLVPEFLGAGRPAYAFMLAGLAETARDLENRNIPMVFLTGDPAHELPRFLKRVDAALLVTDFSPLRLARHWRQSVCDAVTVPVHEVDAHNIVPCRLASPKQEFSAATFRPKIRGLLPRFLTELPDLEPVPEIAGGPDLGRLPRRPPPPPPLADPGWPVTYPPPGPAAARQALAAFLDRGLAAYDTARNDPTRAGQSDLSPYLHFGQISPQRVALAVRDAAAPEAARDAFLEELIVRRELSDNFCWYNPAYDSVEGVHRWARTTLEAHRRDRRDPVYAGDDLEQARTHDDLWNAAQVQLLVTGKMHGYLRMYWAKKILEWSPSPEEAFRVAILLNDRYSLDGRDPNGYAGVAWSVGGVHDRAWGERPIFGKIRFMSYNGCKGKFPVRTFIATWLPRTPFPPD